MISGSVLDTFEINLTTFWREEKYNNVVLLCANVFDFYEQLKTKRVLCFRFPFSEKKNWNRNGWQESITEELIHPTSEANLRYTEVQNI